MYPTLNVPGFTGRALGQIMPNVVPGVPGVTQPAAPTPGDGGTVASVALLGLVGLGAGVLGTLFYYGVAKEGKSNLVKTPGYILAGVSALSTLVTLGATGLAIVAASKR